MSKFSKFPVRDSADELKSALRGAKIHVPSPALFNFILTKIQPYEGGNEIVWQIHKVDIADKHRLLIPLLKIARFTGIALEDREGNLIVLPEQTFIGDRPFRLPIKPDMKLKSQGQPSLHITFDQGVPSYGFDILNTLRTFSDRVSMVVETLEVFLQMQP